MYRIYYRWINKFEIFIYKYKNVFLHRISSIKSQTLHPLTAPVNPSNWQVSDRVYGSCRTLCTKRFRLIVKLLDCISGTANSNEVVAEVVEEVAVVPTNKYDEDAADPP